MTAAEAKEILKSRAGLKLSIRGHEHIMDLIDSVNGRELRPDINARYLEHQSMRDDLREQVEQIDEAVLRMKNGRYKDRLRLYYLEGKTWEEVREALGFSEIKSIYRNLDKAYALFARQYELMEAENLSGARV